MGTPVMRIEDSFEEIDRLEEQFEAVDNIVLVERPADKTHRPVGEEVETAKAGVKRTPSTKKPITRAGSVRAKTGDLSRTGSLRKVATAATAATAAPQGAEKTANGRPLPKERVPRPASLLPPKPTAKSTKPRTMPTFELPGEAVARRLKEQKEARMLGLPAASTTTAVTDTAPRAPSPQKIRSSKQPTRPTFELPGEAISRRKREQHEAKLRAQEEEERRRREFKARPVRNAVAPGSYPRETIASRARQGKAVADEKAEATNNNKRHSMALVGGTASSGAQARGRGTTVESPPSTSQASRAASSSTGSASGKRSTVSAEDVQHQKLRGREIYSRDNSISNDRNREKHDREASAKLARQEAAERSRLLSREWAEKQKQKLKKMIPGSPAANLVAR